MTIDDQIKNLTKQLYPTGRVWRINPNSVKEKFTNGLLASEIRAYNDGVALLDSILPDNANFSVDDAAAWEKRLGLPDGTGLSLADRIKAILVQLNWPGTNPAKGAIDYLQSVLQAAGFNVCAHENLFSSAGIAEWILRSTPTSNNNAWRSIAFGNGLFVAVASGGSVMTSPDGITWTSRTASIASSWEAITFGNGLFVAVASASAGNQVMTSPDGINWTTRSSSANAGLFAIAFGNNTFVAVSQQSGGVQAITSPDGITWTNRTVAAANTWQSITYGNGLFVAVSQNAAGGPRIMTSPDGITWTSQVPANNNTTQAVTYGNGLFVVVCQSGAGNRVMVSSDGVNWISQISAADNTWWAVCFGNNIFVAISQSGFPNNVMTSGGGYFYKTYADFAGNAATRHITTLLHGQQRHGFISSKGIIIANSVDPSGDDNFDIGDGSDTIFIGGCPPGTFINIPKAQEAAFRQLILKIKPVNVTVLLLVNFV